MREPQTEGFEPEELLKCPVCKRYYWKDIVKEHCYLVHGVEVKEVLEVKA